MMNTDNRLLTRESNEHIREFFSTVERLSVSMERLFAGRSPAMAGENFYSSSRCTMRVQNPAHSRLPCKYSRPCSRISSSR